MMETFSVNYTDDTSSNQQLGRNLTMGEQNFTITDQEQNNLTATMMGDPEKLQQLNDEIARQLIPAMLFIFCLIVTGLAGNVVVCFVFSFRLRMNTQNFLIVSLAAFDLLSCTVAMPTEIAEMRFFFVFENEFACRLLRFINFFSAFASILTLVLIAVDRFMKVCRPMGPQMSLRHTKKALVGVVLVALGAALPAPVLYGIRTTNVTDSSQVYAVRDCAMSQGDGEGGYTVAYNAAMFAAFVVILGALAVLYIWILREMRRHNIYMVKNMVYRCHSNYSRGRGGSLSVTSTITEVVSMDTPTIDRRRGSNASVSMGTQSLDRRRGSKKSVSMGTPTANRKGSLKNSVPMVTTLPDRRRVLKNSAKDARFSTVTEDLNESRNSVFCDGENDCDKEDLKELRNGEDEGRSDENVNCSGATERGHDRDRCAVSVGASDITAQRNEAKSCVSSAESRNNASSIGNHNSIVQSHSHIAENHSDIGENHSHIGENHSHVAEDSSLITENENHIAENHNHVAENQSHVPENHSLITENQNQVDMDSPSHLDETKHANSVESKRLEYANQNEDGECAVDLENTDPAVVTAKNGETSKSSLSESCDSDSVQLEYGEDFSSVKCKSSTAAGLLDFETTRSNLDKADEHLDAPSELTPSLKSASFHTNQSEKRPPSSFKTAFHAKQVEQRLSRPTSQKNAKSKISKKFLSESLENDSPSSPRKTKPTITLTAPEITLTTEATESTTVQHKIQNPQASKAKSRTANKQRSFSASSIGGASGKQKTNNNQTNSPGRTKRSMSLSTMIILRKKVELGTSPKTRRSLSLSACDEYDDEEEEGEGGEERDGGLKPSKLSLKQTLSSSSSSTSKKQDAVKTNKATAVAVSVTLVFFISFLPHLSLATARIIHGDFSRDLRGAALVFYNIFLRFYFCNAVANPIIYGVINSVFRNQCVRLMRKVLMICSRRCCCSSSGGVGDSGRSRCGSESEI